MHVELSTLNGEGYISTFSDSGNSICCKPVSASEIDPMLSELSKDKTLCVQQTSDGKTYVVSERKHMNQSAPVEMISPSKQDLEFSRYKQDCRKRALDLAIESAGKFRNDLGSKVDNGKTIPNAETIIPIFADQYYNWLINIPQ